MNTEPIRTVMLPIAAGAFAAAAQAFLDGASTRGIITAVLGVLIVAAQEYARSRVTPVPGPARRGEAGYGVVELVVLVLLVLILAAVLLRLL
jgi:hypothetical protein